MSTNTRLAALLTALVAVSALGGCGSPTPTPPPAPTSTSTLTRTGPLTTSTTVTAAPSCPPGAATMGCSIRPPIGSRATLHTPTPAGTKFPDVSSWQGCQLDWSRIAAPAAVVKADEYQQDPCFRHNVASLKAARKFWAPYLFVRSCSAQAFIATIRSVGGLTSGPAIIDEEVPAADNCTGTLTAQITRAFGREPVEYTSPGTATSGASTGGLPEWVASYGVSRAPCIWTCRPVAWQYTDGASIPRTFINGLGYVDANVDYGLLGMLPPKPKPTRLICFGRHAQLRNGTCQRIRGQTGAWSRQALALHAQAKALDAHAAELHAKAGAAVRAYS